MYAHFIANLIIFLGAINIIRMVFFMVGSDCYSLKNALNRKSLREDFELPTFTVVIPAHNEGISILHSVKSVVNANYPKNKLQLIVVDDGSSDDTYAIVDRYRAENKINLWLIHQENAGKAHALNNGLRNYAVGELVMCLDADSTIAPEALRKAAWHFRDSRVVALSSNVKIRPTGTLFNLIQIFEYIVCYQMKRASSLFNIEYIIGGIGSTFRHSTLKKVGYYDTDTITEDIDLTMKLLQLGNKEHRVIYGADVITYTESVLDMSGLIRQRFRWKYGRAQTFVKNASLFFSKSNRQNKGLTWFYLPYALFSDLAFFFEPFMVSYIGYIIFRYGDWVTFLSAFAVIGTYISMNVLAEDTLPLKQKLKLVAIAPSMYFFFYALTFVEYMALIKTYVKFQEIPKSIDQEKCSWEHVARAEVA